MGARCVVVGLGKLGLPLAAVLASRGVDTVGVDVDEAQVDAVNRGSTGRVSETGLGGLLAGSGLRATTDVGVVAERDVVFVVAPTPSRRDGSFDPSLVCDAIDAMTGSLRARVTAGGFPVVCVVSTVSPGTMDNEVTQVLVDAGLTPREDVGLVYSPAFIALGDVIRGLVEPDLLLLGGARDAVDVVDEVWSMVHSAPRERMPLLAAEVTKLALNTYLGMKVAWANHVHETAVDAGLSDRDARLVCSAVGRDRRVAPAFLAPGVPAGGPCLARDLDAWIHTTGGELSGAPLAAATQTVNAHTMNRIVGEVIAAAQRGGPARWDVAVLGVAYKEGTGVVDGSPSIEVVGRLREHGLSVVTCDPFGAELLGVESVGDPQAAVSSACSAVLMTRDPWWRNVQYGQVVDPWGMLL